MRRVLILNLILAALVVAAAVRFANDRRMFEATHQTTAIQPESEPLPRLPAGGPGNPSGAIDWTEIPAHHPFSYDRTDIAVLQPAAPAAPPKPPGPKPTLFGTMSLGNDKLAMVAPGQGGNRNYRPMKVGETIDGWTITQILDKSIMIAANSIEDSVIMNDPSALVPRDSSRTALAPSVVSVGQQQAPAPVPLLSLPSTSATGQPRTRRRVMQQTPFGVREIEIEE